MSQARLTLDNQVFAGTLRYKRRSVSYVPRPVQSRTIQDIAIVRRQPRQQSTILQKTAKAPPIRQYMDLKPKHVRHHGAQPGATIQPRKDVFATKRSRARNRKILKRLFRKQVLMYCAATLVFGLGLYVSLAGLSANKQVAVQVKTLQKKAEVQGATTEQDNGAPSVDKPSVAALQNHSVSPLNPRYIDIPKLNVHSRVLPMDVTRKNELKSPYNIHDAGWYNASSRPGENGAMLVDGHSGIGKTHGIFHDLMQLNPGDDIIVKRGDGQTYTYKVVRTEVLDVDKVNMGKLLVSENTAKPGLNLITCSGDQVPGTFTLKQRAVAYAVMQ